MISLPRQSSRASVVVITVDTHSQIPFLYHLPSCYRGHYQWVERDGPFLQLQLPSYTCGLPSGAHEMLSHCFTKPNQNWGSSDEKSKGTSKGREKSDFTFIHLFSSSSLISTSKCQLKVYSNNTLKMRWHFQKMYTVKNVFPSHFFTSFSLTSFHLVTLK